MVVAKPQALHGVIPQAGPQPFPQLLQGQRLLRTLVEQLDEEARRVDENQATRGLDRFESMAYNLMTSRKLRDALDFAQEPMAKREEYGMTLFGQAALASRRLLEAGCPLVSVSSDRVSLTVTM